MRLLPWQRGDKGPVAGPTPYDRWMVMARWVALSGAVLLALLSLVPPAMDAGAPNAGSDVNVTAEFYTVLDGGGGYITWDFAGSAAERLRASIDTDGSGSVDGLEYAAYESRIDVQLERNTLVVRNFEVEAVRIEETRGLAGEQVDSGAPAHLKVIMSGGWAAKDADVPLYGDGLVEVAFPNVSQADRITERTIVVAAGFSSFVSSAGETRVPRVPAGAVLVHTRSYLASDAGNHPADARFERFSVANSTLLLLAPLAVAFYLGVRRPRIEQEASGNRRIVPFHDGLAAGFLLLVVAYFAGVAGAVLWVAAIAYGAGGLWAAFLLYPVGRTARWDAPRPLEPEVAPPDKPASPASMEAALALMAQAHRPVGEHGAPDDWATVGPNETDDEPLVPPAALGHPSAFAPPRPAAAGAGGKQAPPRTPSAQLPATSLVRCPGCRHQFQARGSRPLSVACPHCGKKGVLR